MNKSSLLVLGAFMLVGCSSAQIEPSPEPEPTNEPPTAQPTVEPTPTSRPDYRGMELGEGMAIYEPDLTFEWNGVDGWIGFDDLECNGVGLYTKSEDPTGTVDLLALWLRQEHITFGEYACDTGDRAAFARDEVTRWGTREMTLWAVSKLDDSFDEDLLRKNLDVGETICYARQDNYHLIFLHCEDWEE